MFICLYVYRFICFFQDMFVSLCWLCFVSDLLFFDFGHKLFCGLFAGGKFIVAVCLFRRPLVSGTPPGNTTTSMLPFF